MLRGKPRTTVSHMHLLGIPDRDGALALAMQYQLESTQWLDAEELNLRVFRLS